MKCLRAPDVAAEVDSAAAKVAVEADSAAAKVAVAVAKVAVAVAKVAVAEVVKVTVQQLKSKPTLGSLTNQFIANRIAAKRSVAPIGVVFIRGLPRFFMRTLFRCTGFCVGTIDCGRRAFALRRSTPLYAA